MRKIAYAVLAVFLVCGIAYAAGYRPGTNYNEPGGERTVIQGSLDVVSGGDMDIESGATLVVNGTQTFGSAPVPATADGAAVGSATLEWSGFYLADGGIIYFGDDQDVTVTHVADTGIQINAAMKYGIRDSAIYINSSTDGQMDIDADTEVEIATTTLDVNANADVSGTMAIGGITTVGAAIISDTTNTDALGSAEVTFADAFLGDGGVLNFGEDQDVTLTHVADVGLDLVGELDVSTNVYMGTNSYGAAHGVSTTALLQIQHGTAALSGTTVEVDIPIDYSAAPTIVLTNKDGTGGVQVSANATGATFEVTVENSGNDVYWVAVGAP